MLLWVSMSLNGETLPVVPAYAAEPYVPSPGGGQDMITLFLFAAVGENPLLKALAFLPPPDSELFRIRLADEDEDASAEEEG